MSSDDDDDEDDRDEDDGDGDVSRMFDGSWRLVFIPHHLLTKIIIDGFLLRKRL